MEQIADWLEKLGQSALPRTASDGAVLLSGGIRPVLAARLYAEEWLVGSPIQVYRQINKKFAKMCVACRI
jgi:hypothetical protein